MDIEDLKNNELTDELDDELLESIIGFMAVINILSKL